MTRRKPGYKTAIDRVDREEFRRLWHTPKITSSQIGAKFGMSAATVSLVAKQLKLRPRRFTYKNFHEWHASHGFIHGDGI